MPPEIICLDDSDDDEIPEASGLTSASASSSVSASTLGRSRTSMENPARINDGGNQRMNDASNITSTRNIDSTSCNSNSTIIGSSTGNASTTRTHTSISSIGTNSASVSQSRSRPKKKTKPTKAYCLIWVTPHGISPRRHWTKMQLKIVGVYASKADAEQEKRNLMNKYENGGYGDIDLDGTYDGEISLVVREAPMNF